ncbi:DNA-processing protein DprA [Bacteroidota bacterium]
MSLPDRTKAILLLTAHFPKSGDRGAKPLTISEWARLVDWFLPKDIFPEDLFSSEGPHVLHDFKDSKITVERVEALLARGPALALAAEKWTRAGLWIMTRSDPEYPRRLKERLRTGAPPLLFGCGKKSLLSGGGLAVVGSRKAPESELAFARELGQKASQDGFSVVSGGARGVDEASMLGALEADGTSIGVLANGLLSATSSAKYRQHLMDQNLVLVSTFSPEAGFNVGNAMQRNKYIYCLADACVVVHSGTKGGTMTGAMEDLKNQWVPLWVRRTEQRSIGNELIVQQGGRWLPPLREIEIGYLSGVTAKSEPQSDLFAGGREEVSKVAEPQSEAFLPSTGASVATTLYDYFLEKIAVMCADAPQTPAYLKEQLGLESAQFNAWLKRAVEDGALEKLTRPVRYQVKT